MKSVHRVIYDTKFFISECYISAKLDNILTPMLWNDILVLTRHTVHNNIFLNI